MKHFRAPAALALHGAAALAWPMAAFTQSAPVDAPRQILTRADTVAELNFSR